MYECMHSQNQCDTEHRRSRATFDLRCQNQTIVKQRQEKLRTLFTSTASEKSMHAFTFSIRSKQSKAQEFLLAIEAWLRDLQTQIHACVCMKLRVLDYRNRAVCVSPVLSVAKLLLAVCFEDVLIALLQGLRLQSLSFTY